MFLKTCKNWETLYIDIITYYAQYETVHGIKPFYINPSNNIKDNEYNECIKDNDIYICMIGVNMMSIWCLSGKR